MNRVTWIVALSAAFAAALNGTLVMPVLTMAFGRIPGIDETLATLIGSAEIAGVALYCLFLPRLASHRRRSVAVGGTAALIAGEVLSHFMSNVPALAAARLTAGLGEGAIFSLIAAQLASIANAERMWGQINMIGGGAMGALLLCLAALPPSLDRGPVFLWLAAFTAAVTPLILLMRRPAAVAVVDSDTTPLHRRHVGLALLAIMLIYGVQAGQWSVAGYVGERINMPPATITLYLAISSFVGFAGSLLPALTRHPSHRTAAIVVGHAMMIASVYVFFNIGTPLFFLLGQGFVSVGFYMVAPYLTGLLTENDADGSLLMRTLVVALVGAAGGTAAAGAMFDSLGMSVFGLSVIGALFVTLLVVLVLFRQSSASQTTAQHSVFPMPAD